MARQPDGAAQDIVLAAATPMHWLALRRAPHRPAPHHSAGRTHRQVGLADVDLPLLLPPANTLAVVNMKSDP